MNKLSNSSKWIIVGVVAVVAIIVVVVYGEGAGNTGNPQTASSTTTNESSTGPAPVTPVAASPTPSTSTGGSPSPAPAAPAPAPVVIHLITPVPNDQWKFGQQNPIAWDKDPNSTGQIDLLKASDKTLVGVINSETGVHQTSYSWDTRSYYLARYNPLKKDITPGTYLIRIKFDGNNLPDITSGPIIISN